MNILALACGGAFGAVSRYFLSHSVDKLSKTGFPVGTLSVNLLGSFLLGVLLALTSPLQLHPALKLFLFAGFLGAFTTFSTYSAETMLLFNSGRIGAALLTIALHNTLGIVLAFVGYSLFK